MHSRTPPCIDRRSPSLFAPLLLASCLCTGLATAQEAQAGVAVTVGGQYRILGNAANFGWHDALVGSRQSAASFANQRFRTWLQVRTSPEVEAYLQVEMGHLTWGEDFEGTKTYAGPRFPAAVDPNGDRVGVEIRRAWIAYRPATDQRWRVGIQDWQDPFHQTLASSDWDFQAGGVQFEATSASGRSRWRAGAFALWEGSAAQSDDAMLVAVDWDTTFSETRSAGLSAYLLADGGSYAWPTVGPYEDAWEAWVGGRYRWQIGGAAWDGFLIGNQGGRDNPPGQADFRHLGFAGGLQAQGFALAGGEVDFQVLAATGESNPAATSSGEFRTVAQSARDGFGAQGYWSWLAITSPHGPSDVNDLGISLQNRGLGLLTAQARFRAALADDLTSATAVGWLRTAADSPLVAGPGIGVEAAQTFTWTLGGGLALDFGAAWLFTGDYFRPPGGPDPDGLWEVFTRLQLEF